MLTKTPAGRRSHYDFLNKGADPRVYPLKRKPVCSGPTTKLPVSNALKSLLSLSFGMPLIAAAVAISWGNDMTREIADEPVRIDILVSDSASAPVDFPPM